MTIRLLIHVYKERCSQKECQIWEMDNYKPKDGFIEPVLLRSDKFGEVSIYLFTLDRIEGEVAIFHPFATIETSLPLIEDLPKFGYQLIESIPMEVQTWHG